MKGEKVFCRVHAETVKKCISPTTPINVSVMVISFDRLSTEGAFTSMKGSSERYSRPHQNSKLVKMICFQNSKLANAD